MTSLNPMVLFPFIMDPIPVTIIQPAPIPTDPFLAAVFLSLFIPSFILLEYLIVSKAARIPIHYFTAVNIITFTGAALAPPVIIYGDMGIEWAMLYYLVIETLISLIESLAYIVYLSQKNNIETLRDGFRIIQYTLIANYASFTYGIIMYAAYIPAYITPQLALPPTAFSAIILVLLALYVRKKITGTTSLRPLIRKNS